MVHLIANGSCTQISDRVSFAYATDLYACEVALGKIVFIDSQRMRRNALADLDAGSRTWEEEIAGDATQKRGHP